MDWFERFEGAGLDGVVAKPSASAIARVSASCGRSSMSAQRTASWAAFAGTRTAQASARCFSPVRRARIASTCRGGVRFYGRLRTSLVDYLAPYRSEDLEDHPWRAMTADAGVKRRPGGLSRWNAGKDLSWQALAPELVCEVGYDHLQGDRFRHATSFRRWRAIARPGRAPTRSSRLPCLKSLPGSSAPGIADLKTSSSPRRGQPRTRREGSGTCQRIPPRATPAQLVNVAQ